MVPVRQERAQGRDQGYRLVEHDVVPGGRDLDDRGDPAQAVVHDLAHLHRHDAVLGPEQGHPAVEPGQQGGPERLAGEDPPVELPGPAAVRVLGGGGHGADRGLGHVPGDPGQGRLERDRPEVGQAVLAGRVDAQRAEGPLLPGRGLLGGQVTVADRGVDDHRARDLRPVQAGQPERGQATHAVPDHGRRLGQAGVGGHGQDLAGPDVERVVVAAAALAVPGQVQGQHLAVRGQQRADVVPPVRVGATAVDQHDAALAGAAPGQVADGGAVDVDAAGFGFGGQGLGEPLRGGGGRISHRRSRRARPRPAGRW
jgi:hypothetical protein